MRGADRRAVRVDSMPVDAVAEQVARDVRVAKLGGQVVRLIDDAADGHMSAAKIRVRRVFEITISMRVV